MLDMLNVVHKNPPTLNVLLKASIKRVKCFRVEQLRGGDTKQLSKQ